MEKTKKLLFKIILLVILIASYSYIKINYFDKNNSKQVIEKKINISQSIVESDDKSNFINYQIKEGKSALDLLKENTKVETQGEGVNAYVISINNIKALSDNKEYWAFYINGKPADVGAGSYMLKQGDKIEWKIETY